MPTIYTEDKVGQTIEDHYVGSPGGYTGGAANSIGYEEYQNRNNRIVNSARVSSSGTGTYELLPAIQILNDSIPRAILGILAICGVMAAIALAFQTEIFYLSQFTTLSASAGQWAGLALMAAIGALVGWSILPLLLVFIDFGLKLLYVTAIGTIILAVAWIVFKLVL